MATFGSELLKPRCPAAGSRTKQRFKVATAGYLVTITFGAVFIAARIVAPGQAPNVALGAAIVMALPLALAFVGDKIKSFKGLGIEVETKAATEQVTEITPFAQARDDDYAVPRATESGVDLTSEHQTDRADGIPAQVVKIIKSPQSELVELDLRDGTYWWPSRLYLLAALLNDYTSVKRIVFVQATETGTVYAGMARPSAVARRIESSIKGIGAAYQKAREQAAHDLSSTPERYSVPAIRAARMTELTGSS